MDKKALLIQPGAYGDLFICAPIAKMYTDEGYKIIWPVNERFIETISYFPYVKPLLLRNKNLDSDWLRSDVLNIYQLDYPNRPHDDFSLVLNLADRGPGPRGQRQDENFEQYKYRVANVPFSEKNKLVWKRIPEKENSLFEKLGLSESDKYAVVHSIDSRYEEAEIPSINIKTILVSPIKGYNIPDWFKVFQYASEIYCVESSIHQFIDGIITNLTTDKIYLLRRPIVPRGYRATVSTYWRLDYIGKNSIIAG